MLSFLTGWQDAKFRAEIWVIQPPCKVTLNSELTDFAGGQVIPEVLRQTHLGVQLLRYNRTQSANPGSPILLLRGLCEWQLSVGGIHMEPFHQCRPLGPVWLTVARCKSSAHIKSRRYISAGEIFHFSKGRLFKKKDGICLTLTLSSVFFMSINLSIWCEVLSKPVLNRWGGPALTISLNVKGTQLFCSSLYLILNSPRKLVWA